MSFQMRNPPTLMERASLARSRRAFLEDWIETAITLLDQLDGDPDLEPSLGSTDCLTDMGLHASETWAGGTTDDCELDVDSDEGDVLDEGEAVNEDGDDADNEYSPRTRRRGRSLGHSNVSGPLLIVGPDFAQYSVSVLA